MHVDPKPPPRPRPAAAVRARLAPTLAAAIAAIAANAGAQTPTGLSIVPSVQVRQIVTNNVELSPTQARAEAITQATASVAVGSRSGALRGFLNYGLTGQVYARDSSRNQFSSQNALNADADIEVVDGRGFVNVRAAVSQSAVSSLGAQSGYNGLSNANTAEVRTLQVAPRWLGRLGTAVRYTVNGSYGLSSTKGSQVGDSTNSSLNLQLSNANAARVGWAVDAVRQVSGFGAGRSTSSSRLFGTLTTNVDELDLRLGVNAGRETTNLTSLQSTNAATWGLSADWVPSPRTQVNARYDERAFGKTYSLSLTHRTPLTVWQVTDSRSLSISGNALQPGSRGALFDLYFAQFASLEPDPVRRVDLVNAFLRSSGLDPSAGLGSSFLRSAASIQDRLSLSAAYRMPRSTATLILSRTSSRRADTLSTAVDDLSLAGRLHQRSITLNLSHRLTPELSANLSLSGLKGEGSNGAQGNSQRAGNLNVSGRLSPKSSWSLGLRRTLYETSLVPYNESAVTASYSLQL